MGHEKKTLVILDAHALIHRAYHALPAFTSPSGEPMGAVYGVCAFLIKLIRDIAPSHIAAAFDREEKTFRHIAYEAYKGTREKTKDDLVPQFQKTREVFEAFRIPMYDAAGFEADDIIGTLVKRFSKEKDLSIIIASGDMDTLQLVEDKRVTVYTLRKGIDDTVFYNEEKVRERFGFGPEYIIDFKGLKGDPSDNIIGVKGVGEKTATQLITQYGKIEDLYEKIKKEKKHPPWLTERIKNLLLENEEEALFSKELATIRDDAPVKVALDDLVYAGIPVDAVREIFRKFHFPSLAARLPADANFESAHSRAAEEKNTTFLTQENWIEFEASAKKEDNLVLSKEGDRLVIASEKVLFILEKERVADITEALKKLLVEKQGTICDDAKEIFHFLSFAFPIAHDLKIASWVCDSEERTFTIDPHARSTKEGLKLLSRSLESKIKKEKLTDIYYHFELPLVPVLYLMEREGILVDTKKAIELEAEVVKEMHALEKDIWEKAGKKFDINSPKQLSQILFEDLKLPVKGIKKTSTRSTSTQISELQKLKGLHPIIDALIEYREVSKLYSTYIVALPKLVGSDRRIHTTFNQTGTATGRLSSANPNLQNIPIRTERGRMVRQLFIARRGYEFVSCDYSQIELRLAAEFSGDKKMIETFRAGEDIHTRTASEVFHVPRDKVTPNMRRGAKVINFGILYGMGARALAASLGISASEAEEYLEAYFKEFPGVAAFREKIIHDGRVSGYVSTPFGRKRYLPNLRSSFDFVRKEAERMAINAPIQGTEADLVKRAMIEIYTAFKLSEENERIKLLLQVHDELLFEIKKDCADEYIPRIKKIMEHTPEFDIPIIVDIKRGHNWENMKVLEIT
ncbi:MAG: polymerase protein [Parcubacteria group bacterium GW2011_GWA2_47_10b]|nr:MAG: polymerase protein [Parcubacteria group bacterium GW2011_GWA2_47_10b]